MGLIRWFKEWGRLKQVVVLQNDRIEGLLSQNLALEQANKALVAGPHFYDVAQKLPVEGFANEIREQVIAEMKPILTAQALEALQQFARQQPQDFEAEMLIAGRMTRAEDQAYGASRTYEVEMRIPEMFRRFQVMSWSR